MAEAQLYLYRYASEKYTIREAFLTDLYPDGAEMDTIELGGQTFKKRTREGVDHVYYPDYGWQPLNKVSVRGKGWVKPDEVPPEEIPHGSRYVGLDGRSRVVFLVRVAGLDHLVGITLITDHYGHYTIDEKNNPNDVCLDQTYGAYYLKGMVHYGGSRWWWPDHVWSAPHGKFFHKDEKIPPVPLTTADYGLTLTDFPYCCGAKIFYGFKKNVYETEKQSAAYYGGDDRYTTAGAVEVLSKFLENYRGRTTGIILAILNPTQRPIWEPVLLKVGFKLLSSHTNYVHNHPNYLYGFVCEENKTQVKEAKRAFG